MGIVNAFNSSDVLALDTNILISAFNNADELGKKANHLLEKIREAQPRVFISVIAFEEFLVKVYKEKLEKDILKYEDFITGGGMFVVVDVNRNIARKAAQIRAKYPSIRAPDALHVASALESGATMFISTEKRLPRKIGRLTIHVLE